MMFGGGGFIFSKTVLSGLYSVSPLLFLFIFLLSAMGWAYPGLAGVNG